GCRKRTLPAAQSGVPGRAAGSVASCGRPGAKCAPADRGKEPGRVSVAVIAAVCAVSLVAHIASSLLAAYRCRPQKRLLPPPAAAQKVAILRPICGIDGFEALTLRTSFALDYPNVELIFCCDRASDPAAHRVRALLREFPDANARLLVGREP